MKIKYPLTRYPVNARTYRRIEDGWENLEDVQKKRQLEYMLSIGEYTKEQSSLVSLYHNKMVSNASGRVWWAAGSNKENDPFAYYAFYNCSGILFKSHYDYIRAFTNLFLGCGQGEVILNDWSRYAEILEHLKSTDSNLFNLSPLKNVFNLTISGQFGEYKKGEPDYTEVTKLYIGEDTVTIEIGDSREGWASAYNLLFELYTNGDYFLDNKDALGLPVQTSITKEKLKALNINGFNLNIVISSVRAYGEVIKGFGGIANPLYLHKFFTHVTNRLNHVVLTQNGYYTTLDISLLLNESGALAVSGNIRRSAKINQFLFNDPTANAKMGLYHQNEEGQWVVDEDKNVLKYSNFTKMYFTAPTYEEVEEAVRTQYFSGEGAIQFIPVAIARANIDLFLNEYIAISKVTEAYHKGNELELFKRLLKNKYPEETYEFWRELFHRLTRYQLNPCLTGDTLVLTREGFFEIKDLVGKEVEIYTGTKWQKVDNFRVTGENQPIYQVTLSSGETIKATPYHTFVLEDGTRIETEELQVGDRLKFTNNSWLTPGWNTITDITYIGIAEKVYCCTVEGENTFTLANGILSGNCGEVLGSEFLCNLSSLHFNPLINLFYSKYKGDFTKLVPLMQEAFYTCGLIAAPLLKHQFMDEQFRYSREIDPIVLVSFTELFEFFAWLFGPKWCEWWLADEGRPSQWITSLNDEEWEVLKRNIGILCQLDNVFYVKEETEELHLFYGNNCPTHTFTKEKANLGSFFNLLEADLLIFWKEAVFDAVTTYCKEQNLPIPNRCTGLKPEGTGTLLTGHSAGWHPPYAKYYIRRITMDPNSAVAKACFAYGYEVVPGQSDFDENGKLLENPFDPRVTTWLIEVPICVDTLPDWFDSSELSALSQYKFWMQVQEYYTTHNTSSTILFREHEIPILAQQIHEDISCNEPYMSTTLLARGEVTFPRMPYEKCTKKEYERRLKKINQEEDFYHLVAMYDKQEDAYSGPIGCDSDFCEMK